MHLAQHWALGLGILLLVAVPQASGFQVYHSWARAEVISMSGVKVLCWEVFLQHYGHQLCLSYRYIAWALLFALYYKLIPLKCCMAQWVRHQWRKVAQQQEEAELLEANEASQKAQMQVGVGAMLGKLATWNAG